jgi:hypothetical protein
LIVYLKDTCSQIASTAIPSVCRNKAGVTASKQNGNCPSYVLEVMRTKKVKIGT